MGHFTPTTFAAEKAARPLAGPQTVAAMAKPASDRRRLRPLFQAPADETFIDPELAWAVTG
jgi:hypothetical protein